MKSKLKVAKALTREELNLPPALSPELERLTLDYTTAVGRGRNKIANIERDEDQFIWNWKRRVFAAYAGQDIVTYIVGPRGYGFGSFVAKVSTYKIIRKDKTGAFHWMDDVDDRKVEWVQFGVVRSNAVRSCFPWLTDPWMSAGDHCPQMVEAKDCERLCMYRLDLSRDIPSDDGVE